MTKSSGCRRRRRRETSGKMRLVLNSSGWRRQLLSDLRQTKALWLYFIVVYGVVGNRSETDRLLREVDTWVMEIGHHYPLFVVGDFNMELLDSQVTCGSITAGPMRPHERQWPISPWKTSLQTHRSLRIRLHLAAFTQQKLMRYKPVPLDTTPRIS